jgi:hypothetical protein
MKGFTMLSKTASSEQDAAIGSEVSFEVEESNAEGSKCAMWLSSSGSKMGLTTDARFMKPYMRAVEEKLRALDPAVSVSKS